MDLIKSSLLAYLVVLDVPEVLEQLTPEEGRVATSPQAILGCLHRLDVLLREHGENGAILMGKIAHRENVNGKVAWYVNEQQALPELTKDLAWCVLRFYREHIDEV
jgi:hypothetical protein